MVHLLVNSFARKGKGHEQTEIILKAFRDRGVDVTLIEGATLTEVETKIRNLVNRRWTGCISISFEFVIS